MIRRHVDGDGRSGSLKDRIGDGVEIISPVIHRDCHRSGRESPGVESGQGLGERENGIAQFREEAETGLEVIRRHIESGIPLMLVTLREPVVAEDQKPVGSPPASARYAEPPGTADDPEGKVPGSVTKRVRCHGSRLLFLGKPGPE